MPFKGKQGTVCISLLDPCKACRITVHLIKSRLILIQLVQGLHIRLNIGMSIKLEEGPIQLIGLVELLELCKFLTHEKQLLSRVCHHKTKCRPEIGELILIASGHLLDQRSLLMNHLVMGKHQNEFLTVGINHTECEVVVMILPVQRIQLHVTKEIVHPAHVPLVIKAHATLSNGMCHHRPCRGLLSDHHNTGEQLRHFLVHLFDECDGLQILISAKPVGLPLTGSPAVVQIKHGRNRIHTDPVNMVLICPVQRI